MYVEAFVLFVLNLRERQVKKHEILNDGSTKDITHRSFYRLLKKKKNKELFPYLAATVRERARMEPTEEQLLRQLNDDKVRAYAPAIAFSAIVVVCGILGNALSVAFYGFKVPRTSTNIIITVLAVVDFTTCIVLSDEILELCFTVTFKSVGGCKTMYFFNHSLVLMSVFTLLLVAVDLFRKICRPFAWQFSIFTLKVSFASIVVLSVVSSVRDLVILDVVRVNVTYSGKEIQAYYCTHSKAKSLANTVKAFQYIDFLYLVVVVVSTVILYSCIAKSLWKSRKAIKQHKKQSFVINNVDTSESEATSSRDIDTDTNSNVSLNESQSQKNDIKEERSGTFQKDIVVSADVKTCQSGSLSQRNKGNSKEKVVKEHRSQERNNGITQLEDPVCNNADLGNSDQETDPNEEKTLSMVLSRKDEKDIDRDSGLDPNQDVRGSTERCPEAPKIERKVTLMMFTISVVFLISFLPYFFVNLWIKRQDNSSAQEFNAGIQIALRSYMLNNAINPYIIGLFNPNFRSFVNSLLFDCRIFSRR